MLLSFNTVVISPPRHAPLARTWRQMQTHQLSGSWPLAHTTLFQARCGKIELFYWTEFFCFSNDVFHFSKLREPSLR
jgi:hypothetical protein